MAGIFEKARTLLNWSAQSAQGTHSDFGVMSLSWGAGTALAPILPPTDGLRGVSSYQAMTCPPVSRGVGLYSAAMLRHAWHSGNPATVAWLNRPAGPLPSKIRDVRTLVDIILQNRACWALGRFDDGTIYNAAHIPAEVWGFNERGEVVIGDTVADPNEVIVFHGAKPMPFLDLARDTLTHYADITATMKSRGSTPAPLHELKLREDYDGLRPGEQGYDPEFDEVLIAQKGYAAARRSPDGAVSVTPKGIDLVVHQTNDDGSLLIGARNAVRLDVANHLNLNAELLDGDNGTSDTYSTTLQNVGDFKTLSLPLFFDPITARLSLDDVTPEGEVVSLRPDEVLSVADHKPGHAGATPESEITA